VKRPAITSPRSATSAGTSSSQPETGTGSSRSPWSFAKPSRISRSKPGRPCSWKNSSACFISTASTRSEPRALTAARSAASAVAGRHAVRSSATTESRFSNCTLNPQAPEWSTSDCQKATGGSRSPIHSGGASGGSRGAGSGPPCSKSDLRVVGRAQDRGVDARHDVGVGRLVAQLHPGGVVAEGGPRLLASGDVREREHVGEARQPRPDEVAAEEDGVHAEPAEDRELAARLEHLDLLAAGGLARAP